MNKIFYVTAGVYINCKWSFNIVNQIIIAKTLDEAESVFKSNCNGIKVFLKESRMSIQLMSISDDPLGERFKPELSEFSLPVGPEHLPKDDELETIK